MVVITGTTRPSCRLRLPVEVLNRTKISFTGVRVRRTSLSPEEGTVPTRGLSLSEILTRTNIFLSETTPWHPLEVGDDSQPSVSTVKGAWSERRPQPCLPSLRRLLIHHGAQETLPRGRDPTATRNFYFVDGVIVVEVTTMEVSVQTDHRTRAPTLRTTTGHSTTRD